MAKRNSNQKLTTEELLVHKLWNTFEEQGTDPDEGSECLGHGCYSKALPARGRKRVCPTTGQDDSDTSCSFCTPHYRQQHPKPIRRWLRLLPCNRRAAPIGRICLGGR